MVTRLRSVRDEEDARELLRQWEASRESMGAWCRKNGVARQSLQWWRGRVPAAGAVVRVAEVVLPRPGPEYRILLGRAGGVQAAIGYCRDQWPNLMRFLTDPAVDPTNNAAERLLKPAALLRKNSVFAGSDAGADRGATMLSIVNTCRLIAVDAEAYIVWALDQMAERRVTRERLAELGGGPAPPIRYDDLTPAAYKAMLARAAATAARGTPRPADPQPTA